MKSMLRIGGLTFFIGALAVMTVKPHRHVQADCGGEFTRAIARIPDSQYNYQMVVRHATNPADAWRRAKKCRADAENVTFFHEGARLACAPYLACDTQ